VQKAQRNAVKRNFLLSQLFAFALFTNILEKIDEKIRAYFGYCEILER